MIKETGCISWSLISTALVIVVRPREAAYEGPRTDAGICTADMDTIFSVSSGP